MAKHYKIAGLNVLMDTFGKTEERAKKYLCEPFEKADICVKSEFEKWHKIYPHLSAEDCELMSTGTYFNVHLADYNGLHIHSSAVVVDGKAYLFSAFSGTGKSTHTKLWLQMFGERAYILNDDKPALRLIDGVWYAFGTPWSGKYDISVNKGVPVGGIAFLERGESNEISSFNGPEAIRAILEQTNRCVSVEFRMKLLKNLNNLVSKVPIWKLKCNMDPEAAIVSYEAMSGEKFVKEN